MPDQPTATPAAYPAPAKMTKEHIVQYRLYDRDNNLIASGQAALDQWRPGLTSRWIVPDDKPPRRISDEARYRGRRRRLRKRLQAKTPLFWKDLEKTELEKRPKYYGLTDGLTADADANA